MNASTIVIRVVIGVLLLIGGLKLLAMWNQKRAVDELFEEMRVLTTDASYLRQFDSDEATRTLLRLMVLMWKAENQGVPPERVIDRIFLTEKRMFDNEKKPPVSATQRLIRDNLEFNRDALRKLGYPADRTTFEALEAGRLPALTDGPFARQQPIVHRVIDPTLSPGLDTVIANFEIRPPGEIDRFDDVNLARARQLVRQLRSANIIESDAAERLSQSLERPAEEP